ncbi:hypothetical protein ACSQ67_025497 [Phaseolus vulgaris]
MERGTRHLAKNECQTSRIEHGGWKLRSSVCRCCHVQHSAVWYAGIGCGDVLISLHSALKPPFLCFSDR